MQCLLLETVYSEVLNGDSNFAKCFVIRHVAVLRLKIIRLIGNFSMPPPSESLWMVAVTIKIFWGTCYHR